MQNSICLYKLWSGGGKLKKKKSTQLGKIPFSDTDTSTKLFIQMKVKNACVHFCQTAVHRIDNSTQESK